MSEGEREPTMSLAALAAKAAKPAVPIVTLNPAEAGNKISFGLSFTGEPPRQRPKLKLAARSKPTADNEWDLAASSGQAWQWMQTGRRSAAQIAADLSRKMRSCSCAVAACQLRSSTTSLLGSAVGT